MLATAGCGNSQRIFGQDVLSRIKASVAGTGEKLKTLIRQDILNLLEEIQKKQKDIVIEHIYIARKVFLVCRFASRALPSVIFIFSTPAIRVNSSLPSPQPKAEIIISSSGFG